MGVRTMLEPHSLARRALWGSDTELLLPGAEDGFRLGPPRRARQWLLGSTPQGHTSPGHGLTTMR